MANDLAEYRLWLQTLLMDSGAKSWDLPTLDAALRLALMDLSRVSGAALTLQDLDEAHETTLSTLDRGALLLGASAYAARARALDLSEKAALGEKNPEAMAGYARDQLTLFLDQLAAMGQRSLHKSTRAPYSALYWDEGYSSNQGSAPPQNNDQKDDDGGGDSNPPPEEEIMQREIKSVTAIIASGGAISGVIDATWAAAQGLKAPAALEATSTLAFKVAESQDGAFLPLYNELNVLVEVPVTLNAARAYQLPDELFAWPYFKLWTESGGVDVAQSSDRTFVVTLKS